MCQFFFISLLGALILICKLTGRASLARFALMTAIGLSQLPLAFTLEMGLCMPYPYLLELLFINLLALGFGRKAACVSLSISALSILAAALGVYGAFTIAELVHPGGTQAYFDYIIQILNRLSAGSDPVQGELSLRWSTAVQQLLRRLASTYPLAIAIAFLAMDKFAYNKMPEKQS